MNAYERNIDTTFSVSVFCLNRSTVQVGVQGKS